MPYTFKTSREEYTFKTREERDCVVEIHKFVDSIATLAHEMNYATKESIQETLDLIQSDMEKAQMFNNEIE